MWFAAPNLDQVSALDPSSGEVTDYALPGGNGSEQPRYIGMAPDGTLWITEFGGPNIANVSGVTSTTRPTVTSLSPGHGNVGDQITITGTNLGATTAVMFGGTTASYAVVDPGHLTATVPTGSGTVDVTVTTPNGTSATGVADHFAYGGAQPVQPTVSGISPTTGPVAGGTAVTISGTDLSGGTVAFGDVAATGVSCTATSCSAKSPAGTAGTVDVTVTTDGGTSDSTAADRFTYLTPPPPAPTVTRVSPASGPTSGGNTVTVTGTRLSGAMVSFGLEAAPAAHCTDTSCTVTAPAGQGVVDIRAETAGGTSARNNGDQYTYHPDASALSIGTSATIKYGTVVTISTKLTDTTTKSGLAGMAVTLWRRASAKATWAKVAAKTTSSTGTASMAVRPTGYDQYQWRFGATATHAGVTSATQSVAVSQVVSIKATRTTVRHGTTVTDYGTVNPPGTGQKIYLQRLVGSKWVTAASATLKKQRLPNGVTTVGYLFTVKTAARGTFRYRVTKLATTTLAQGISATVTLKVT
jgi:hypothetical protein